MTGPPTDRPTILVVEDNPLNLKLVRDVLRYAGYASSRPPPGRTASASPPRSAPTWC